MQFFLIHIPEYQIIFYLDILHLASKNNWLNITISVEHYG